MAIVQDWKSTPAEKGIMQIGKLGIYNWINTGWKEWWKITIEVTAICSHGRINVKILRNANLIFSPHYCTVLECGLPVQILFSIDPVVSRLCSPLNVSFCGILFFKFVLKSRCIPFIPNVSFVFRITLFLLLYS